MPDADSREQVMLTDPKRAFSTLLNEAKQDPNILAFWLDGSRGKGLETEYSDYDCTMIVDEDVSDQYLRRYRDLDSSEIDLSVMTLTQFRNYAAWGSDTAWARYNFTHLTALVDKTDGEAQRLIDDKSQIPLEAKTQFITGSLDHFINQTYRSLKAFRDGKSVGARLEAAEGVTPFLDAVFALHDRLRPYYKYLDWELKRAPLTRFNLSTDKMIQYVLDILENGAARSQQNLLIPLEELATVAGYCGVFADWGAKLEWMKTVFF
jgi:hypothetical protein